MKIDIYATGRVAGNKDNRQAGCGIVLVATHDDGRTQRRDLSYKLGDATLNLACLKAVWLGLLAVKTHKAVVILHVNNHYVVDMLAKIDDKYKSTPLLNKAAVEAMRNAYAAIDNISISNSKLDNNFGAHCSALADEVLYHDPIDTGTIEITNEQGNSEETGTGTN